MARTIATYAVALAFYAVCVATCLPAAALLGEREPNPWPELLREAPGLLVFFWDDEE